MKMKKHWYRQYVGGCPVCGNDASYRERVYGNKPKNDADIYVYIPDSQTYDSCMER